MSNLPRSARPGAVLRVLVLAAAGCGTVPRPAPVGAPPVPDPPPADAPAGPLVLPIVHLEPVSPPGESLPDRLPAPAAGPAEPPAGVTPVGGLSLAAVEELAMANNPTLVQGRAQVEGTLGKALQAGLWPNPVLGYEAEKLGLPDVPAEFQGGFIEQEIVTARKRRVSREKYLARARAAECVALAQQFRVVNDLRRQYWRAAGADRLVGIHEQLVKTAVDRLATTEEMFNVGQATVVDVRQARINLQRVKLDLLMVTNDRDRHRRELAALAGADLAVVPLADALDAPVRQLTWEAARAYTLAESPEVREAVAKLQADRITVDRERREPIPNVFVRVAPGYDYNERERVANAEVRVRVPIWNWNQGTVRQAEADLLRQQAEVRRVELRLARDLADRYRDYLTAGQHVDVYRDTILPEAEQAYQARLDAYKQRRETWPMVLDAQAELYRRQAEYVRNLVVWRESRTLIEGFLLSGGLEPPPNPTPPGHIDAVAQPR